MADVKISALPSSTTPLTGTEVLPVVQSSVTKKVSVADLTTGRTVTSASFVTSAPQATNSLTSTTGTSAVYQTMTNSAGNIWFGRDNSAGTSFGAGSYAPFLYSQGSYDFNFIISATSKLKIGASSGDITSVLGNVVIGTAGKGIDFSANTAAPGATSELLNWYEEGTATAVLTDGTNNATLAAGSGMIYTRIGRLVMVQGYIEVSNIGSVSGALRLAGLPFNVNSSSRSAFSVGQSGGLAITAGQSMTGFGQANTDYIRLYVWTATTGSTPMTNTQLSTGGFISFSFNYVVA